jgi:multicomponent Na+:H+ antiporter subunit G
VTVDAMRPWLADGFILLGVAVMTLGVFGVYRMPDIFTQLHAASKSVFLGVCSLLVAMLFSGSPDIAARAVLIGLLLILTTPIAAHEIARAAVREQAARAEQPAASVPPSPGST